jgi:tetratricopeptide (TPR) repeat protein
MENRQDSFNNGGTSRGIAIRLADGLRAYWPLIATGFSVIVGIVAWVGLDVSPLESAREIAHQKEERDYQRQLTLLHLELGNDFLDVGQLDAAKTEFERAKQLDTYNVAAEFGLLKVSIFEPIAKEAYDPEVAQRRLAAVLNQDPNDSHALAYLGEVYREINPALALQYFERASQSNPRNAWAYFKQGVLLDQAGNENQAIAMYEKAVSLSPWDQLFLNNLGYAHFRLGDYKKSENIYKLLLSLDGRFLLSYYMLANSQMRLGDFESASATLKALDGLINDEATRTLPRNNDAYWYWMGPDGEIRLYSWDEKKVYAKYLTALDAYLLGRPSDVQSLGQSPEGEDTSPRLLITMDLADLQKLRPDLKNTLASFRSLLPNK